MNLPILVTRGSSFILNMAPAISFCSLRSARRSSASLYMERNFHMRKVDRLPSRWVWPTRIWAVERVALALQADGRGEYKAGYGDDGQHGTAERDVEGALDGAVDKARAIPVHDGLHGLVAAGTVAPIHCLGRRARHPPVLLLNIQFYLTLFLQTYVPSPGILPVP